MPKPKLPAYEALMNPTIQALKELGGSGTVDEIFTKVSEIANLSDDQLAVLHNPQKSSQTEIEYRLAWARTYLRIFGVLENSGRGVWALSPTGRKIDRVDEKEVKRLVREQAKRERDTPETEEDTEIPITAASGDESVVNQSWRDELLETLLKIEPAAFERLVQRILRESGFIQVKVTGRSGDGGVDGRGIMRLGGLLSFHVIFQCKRWRNTVSVSQIRDFRGAMVGRADKGLFITTGSFTQDAIKEATRDGAPPIDLIDGDQLLDKLKELSLGLSTQKVQIEKVSVDREWFATI